jgi:DNA end-binding protein Ku
MAARSIASLTISFGLVAIPVKLYSATEASQTISFNLLHKACGSRVRQQYFCAKEDIPITRDEMVKGYEFAKDQYVMFTPEELKALEETGTHSADITDFVPISTVDPVYFDKSYYLAPDKGGAKPYALLAKALRESKRCAIGHWATRGKQYIVMIRPVEDGLVMQQLLYAKEVRAIGDLDIPVMDVREAELKLAKQLIEQQSSAKFDPAAYHDDVSARIQKAIEKKVEGHEISVSEAPEGGGGAQIIDLMEALRASLDKKAAAKGGKPAASAEAEPKVRKPPKRAGASPAAPAAAKKAAKK